FQHRLAEPSVKIEGAISTKLQADDCLILPEIYQEELETLAPGVPKILFNQNAYLLLLQKRDPFRSLPSDVVGVLCVSEDNQRFLQTTYPSVPTQCMRNSVDARLFRPAQGKQRLISVMPPKNASHRRAVLSLLHSRGHLCGYRFQILENMPESDVAKALGVSRVFLSFGFPEGFSLPPAEAMASGNYVVGYHGRAAMEFMLPEFCSPIEYMDISGMVQATEAAIVSWEAEPEQMDLRVAKARDFVIQNYSLEKEVASIEKAWSVFGFRSCC
ncbi:MAG TPA: hypothetical protein VLM37_01185, partial [Fibrobacteraceae bacterium]|nr:hypothetical protein [Fibrobacteraceae bacterium]